jgi:hypothetical protein
LCQKFVLDANGGMIKDLVTEKPVERAKPPDCRLCKKFEAGFKGGWKFGNDNIFRLYQLSQRFNCLPSSGGLNDQVPELLEMFYYLNVIEANYERTQSRSFNEFKGQYQ